MLCAENPALPLTWGIMAYFALAWNSFKEGEHSNMWVFLPASTCILNWYSPFHPIMLSWPLHCVAWIYSPGTDAFVPWLKKKKVAICENSISASWSLTHASIERSRHLSEFLSLPSHPSALTYSCFAKKGSWFQIAEAGNRPIMTALISLYSSSISPLREASGLRLDWCQLARVFLLYFNGTVGPRVAGQMSFLKGSWALRPYSVGYTYVFHPWRNSKK